MTLRGFKTVAFISYYPSLLAFEILCQVLRNGIIGMWPKLPEAKKLVSKKTTSRAVAS